MRYRARLRMELAALWDEDPELDQKVEEHTAALRKVTGLLRSFGRQASRERRRQVSASSMSCVVLLKLHKIAVHAANGKQIHQRV